jgi:hypothetical protein
MRPMRNVDRSGRFKFQSRTFETFETMFLFGDGNMYGMSCKRVIDDATFERLKKQQRMLLRSAIERGCRTPLGRQSSTPRTDYLPDATQMMLSESRIV